MTEPRQPWWMPLAFGLAVALARLPVLLSHQDTWYPFEVHSGTIARALLDGVDVDVAGLPIVPHARGSVLFGLLLVPLYALAGASSFTMKLLPVLWHGATVAVLVGLLDRHVGRRAAASAGVLLLFAPPMITKLSTVGLASHLESALPWLLALAAALAIAEAGPSRGRAFRLGACVGFAGFFHLQALLPALLVVALLAAHELRARRRPGSAAVLAFLGGAVLLAAPSFLFDGGNVALLASGVFTADGGIEASPAAADGRLAKLAALFTGDLRAALEFGDGAVGRALGAGFVAALGAGALLGLALVRRTGITGAFFALHVLMVAGLYTVSELTVEPEVGTGATNRHLAPMVWSLLGLTATAAAARRRLALVPVAVLAVAGAGSLPSVLSTGEAARVPQRGECYEWFTRHLHQETRGDPDALVSLLERVDPGDPRFRTLRFRVVPPRIAADAQALLARTGSAAAAPPDAAALFRWTAIGRHLASRRDAVTAAARERRFDGLPALAREALLHGVGLGLEPPRGVAGLDRVERFLEHLGRFLRSLEAGDARAVAEGYGFQLGSVFDPYNPKLAAVVLAHADLEPRFAVAFARGFAWGHRQRGLVPPVEVPDDLAASRLLQDDAAAAFAEAYRGDVLPREAEPSTR